MVKPISQRRAITHLGLCRRLRELPLGRVPDPRGRRGRRHRDFSSILMAVLLGLLSNRLTRRDAAEQTQELRPGVRRELGIPAPISATRLRDALMITDVDALRCCMRAQVKAISRRGHLSGEALPLHAVAIDGKHLATVGISDHPWVQNVKPDTDASRGLIRVHNACLISTPQPICLDLSPIPGDTNEIGHMPAFLDELFEAYERTDLLGLIMTDGGNASAGVATQINDQGRGYMLRLTEMQGGIYTDARLALDRARALTSRVEYRDGKPITYRLYRVRANDWRDYGWANLRQWVRIERITAEGKVGKRDWATNLAWNLLSDEQMLEVVRRYWNVETGLHEPLDVVWREDASRTPWITEANGVVALAVLRRIAFNVLSVLRRLTRKTTIRGRPLEWRKAAERSHRVLTAMEEGRATT